MPGRAPKACGRQGCPTLVRGRTYCDEHTPVAWSGAGHGSTRAWRTLREQVLAEERWCRDCDVAPSTEAGHIIPRSQGGQDVRSNLKAQCRPCNVAQIQSDARQYGGARAATGEQRRQRRRQDSDQPTTPWVGVIRMRRL